MIVDPVDGESAAIGENDGERLAGSAFLWQMVLRELPVWLREGVGCGRRRTSSQITPSRGVVVFHRASGFALWSGEGRVRHRVAIGPKELRSGNKGEVCIRT